MREWLATSAEGRAYADRHAPPPRAAALPVLTTRPGSRYFHAADTGAIVDYREATAMGIFRIWLDSPGALDPLMDWYVDHGVTAIRVLCNLDSEYWRSRHRPNSYREGDRYFGQLVPFSEYAAATAFMSGGVCSGAWNRSGRCRGGTPGRMWSAITRRW